jgi:hypothetical protein
MVLSDEPDDTLLYSCGTLVEFWVLNVGVWDGDIAKLFGVFASEKPHCGQNVACLRTSALHCGQ